MMHASLTRPIDATATQPKSFRPRMLCSVYVVNV